MIALLDVNVLISLLDADHPAHLDSRHWFEAHHAEGWATCPITQNGCVRIMSAVSYANPLPLADVAAQLSKAVQSAPHAFWADDVSILDSTLVDPAMCKEPSSSRIFISWLWRSNRVDGL